MDDYEEYVERLGLTMISSLISWEASARLDAGDEVVDGGREGTKVARIEPDSSVEMIRGSEDDIVLNVVVVARAMELWWWRC